LLTLALLIAGQCLSASHWHDSNSTTDFDCALCVLSSATSGAALSSGWLPFDLPLFVFVFFLIVPCARRAAQRFHDSRAPPYRS